MKVGPVTEAIRTFESIRDRQEGGSRQQHQNQKDEKEKDQPQFEVTDEKVGEAMQAFQSDAQTKANGLNASMVGHGPGLKVVLRDGRGAIVRQFTGEEFLKMREAVSKEGRSRGKILDQKF